jgi:hypothetical protein
MNSRRLVSLLAVACLPFALAACQPDGPVRVLNKTSATLTIQAISSSGKVADVATLAPGDGTSVQPAYEDTDNECTKDARFQAVDARGVVVSRLTAVCSKDEWVINN